MNTAILIPARIGSTRFPDKPLKLLNGVPMIRRVYDRCLETGLDTFVLTDSRRVASLFPEGHVWVDDTPFENGTERCAGYMSEMQKQKLHATGYGWDYDYDQFVNVQGDMPDVTVSIIEKCIWHLKHYPITTVFTEMPKEKQNDPSTVKMVRAGDQALWFGRGLTGYGEWHLGVYGYKRNPLDIYPNLVVSQEEDVEKLEQLRWLKSGWQIGCLSVQYNGMEINTPEDLKEWHSKNSQ